MLTQSALACVEFLQGAWVHSSWAQLSQFGSAGDWDLFSCLCVYVCAFVGFVKRLRPSLSVIQLATATNISSSDV